MIRDPLGIRRLLARAEATLDDSRALVVEARRVTAINKRWTVRARAAAWKSMIGE